MDVCSRGSFIESIWISSTWGRTEKHIKSDFGTPELSWKENNPSGSHSIKMVENDNELAKSYRSVLFLTQFLIKPAQLERLSDKLPGILSRVGVTDEEKRIKIIDQYRILVEDFKAVKQSAGKSVQLIAHTTTNFINSALALFGLLVAITSVENLLVNLIFLKRLDSSVSLESFKNIGKISASLGLVSSSVPLVDAIIPGKNKNISTFLTTFIALHLYPKPYSRDLLSIYLAVYGAESLQNYLTSKGKLKSLKEDWKVSRFFTKTWFLIPLTLSQLYHDYIIHPEYTPALVKRVFDSLFKDIYDTKPAWYEKEWPTVSETTALIRRATIEGDRKVLTTILHRDVTNITSFQPAPLHTNKILSITNPTEPSPLRIILRFVPSKYLKLMLFLTPLYFVKDLIFRQITFKELKTKWKSYFATLLKTTSKLSIFGIFATITAHFLTAQNINTRSPIKQYKLIGFIAGLWGLMYRETANTPIISYVLRITLLSIWRRQVHDHPSLDKYNVDLVLNALGITTLVGLVNNGLGEHIVPKRLASIAGLISKGGKP